VLRLYLIAIFIVALLSGAQSYGQLPVEVFAGHERTTFDLMFFKYFKNSEGAEIRWLFFNRNRASIDYNQTATANLPQFGFTEALSYNHKALKGIAPVLVAQVLNRGTFAKGGVQYALVRKKLTVFSWVVGEIKSEPTVDLFLLMRYTPKLTERLKLFTQLESLNVFPTATDNNKSYIQRIRLGIKRSQWQTGLGADFNQSGSTNGNNAGIFIRHEF
jgi:hypothetical protein